MIPPLSNDKLSLRCAKSHDFEVPISKKSNNFNPNLIYLKSAENSPMQERNYVMQERNYAMQEKNYVMQEKKYAMQERNYGMQERNYNDLEKD